MLSPWKKGSPVIDPSTITVPFPDRYTAGQLLAKSIEPWRDGLDSVVLALPHGGAAVGKAIATALHAPLDLLLVQKVSVPGRNELAMAAVASNDVVIRNDYVITRAGISKYKFDESIRTALDEVHRREKTYRGDRPALQLKDRIVILADDGLVTGTSMRGAIEAVRKQEPASIIVAVPVAPPDTVSRLEETADEIVCLITPEPFYGISDWYGNFSRLTDDDVRDLLAAA